MHHYIKRRGSAPPGSIPAVLEMYQSEVKFYREIAPVVGVRVPACYEAEETDQGTMLVLEDLSHWSPGADPVAVVGALSVLHDRWVGEAHTRWPWLRPVAAAADLVNELFEQIWPDLTSRADLSPQVRELGERLVGKVVEAERNVALAGPLTLVHGDAAAQNFRTGPDGEVAFLDWEDVSAAPGSLDLAWLLISSVEPARWNEVIAAYGSASGLTEVLPAIAVQGLLSMSDMPEGSEPALAWNTRLQEAANRLNTRDPM